MYVAIYLVYEWLRLVWPGSQPARNFDTSN